MEQKLYPPTASLMSPSAPYDVESKIDKRLQSELQIVNSFNNSIQNISLMMKYYELEENKYKKKYTKYKLINNMINSTDCLIRTGTTSASVTLSITGVGIIVVPITAGVGCVTGILVKICSSYLKKKEQNYKLEYTIIQKTLATLDNYLPLDKYIDEKEYHRFVTQFEKYQVASRAASHTTSHTKSHVASRATATATSHTPPTIPLKPHNNLLLIYSILT